MIIPAKRLNKLTKLTTQNAMNTLEAGLPEVPKYAFKALKAELEVLLDDLIESHFNAMTEEESL